MRPSQKSSEDLVRHEEFRWNTQDIFDNINDRTVPFTQPTITNVLGPVLNRQNLVRAIHMNCMKDQAVQAVDYQDTPAFFEYVNSNNLIKHEDINTITQAAQDAANLSKCYGCAASAMSNCGGTECINTCKNGTCDSSLCANNCAALTCYISCTNSCSWKTSIN